MDVKISKYDVVVMLGLLIELVISPTTASMYDAETLPAALLVLSVLVDVLLVVEL